MNEDCDFYICSVCFNTHEAPTTCFRPGDADLKPLMDEAGNLKSSAPRWFLRYIEAEHGRLKNQSS